MIRKVGPASEKAHAPLKEAQASIRVDIGATLCLLGGNSAAPAREPNQKYFLLKASPAWNFSCRAGKAQLD